MASAYLTHNKSLQEAGELSQRTWRNCEEAATAVGQFGKTRLVADLGQDDVADVRKWMAKK